MTGQRHRPQIVLATGNPHKRRELRQRFASRALPFDLVALESPPDPVESGATFVANARIKADAFAAASGSPALADDSGLAVAALDGAPGVYSSRYAERAGSPWCERTIKDAANMLHLLDELDGLDDRRAAFECALVLVVPAGPLAESVASVARDSEGVTLLALRESDDVTSKPAVTVVSRGRTTGRIVPGPAELGGDGRPTVARGAGGFGYDPIFLSDDLRITFGQADAEAKNRVSHRARALEPMLRMLHDVASRLDLVETDVEDR